MERLTLYHCGTPISYHPLKQTTFSIGSSEHDDLMLAGYGIKERHLCLVRDEANRWEARFEDTKQQRVAVEPGARLPFGAYALEVQGSGRQHPDSPKVSSPMIGDSPSMSLLRRDIERTAPLRAPVFICGETGTGKELVARQLHDLSPRREGPFVPVNCGALTASLLEDTLFGHERGAFTGAGQGRKGVFEQARGGTLFLDEIGELPLEYQSALLRVLDTQEIVRIGAENPLAVDVRIVAATNRGLEELAQGNQFRRDLYHRISTIQLTTPPLRERKSDLAQLAEHLLEKHQEEIGPRRLSQDALLAMGSYHWPGNVRELRNLLIRWAVQSAGPVIEQPDLTLPGEAPRPPKKASFSIEKISNGQLRGLVKKHHGNVAQAAREIGLARTTLRDLLGRRGIDPKTASV